MFQIVKMFKNMLKLATFFLDSTKFCMNSISKKFFFKILGWGHSLRCSYFFDYFSLDVLIKSVLNKKSVRSYKKSFNSFVSGSVFPLTSPSKSITGFHSILSSDTLRLFAKHHGRRRRGFPLPPGPSPSPPPFLFQVRHRQGRRNEFSADIHLFPGSITWNSTSSA